MARWTRSASWVFVLALEVLSSITAASAERQVYFPDGQLEILQSSTVGAIRLARARDRLLLVWEDYSREPFPSGSVTIRGLWLDLEARATGEPFEIAAGAGIRMADAVGSNLGAAAVAYELAAPGLPSRRRSGYRWISAGGEVGPEVVLRTTARLPWASLPTLAITAPTALLATWVAESAWCGRDLCRFSGVPVTRSYARFGRALGPEVELACRFDDVTSGPGASRGGPRQPRVAEDGGRYLLAWPTYGLVQQDQFLDFFAYPVYTRLVEPSGAAVGPLVKLGGSAASPSAAALDSGGFLVTWAGTCSYYDACYWSGERQPQYLAQLDADGQPVGAERPIHIDTYYAPEIAATATGDVLLTLGSKLWALPGGTNEPTALDVPTTRASYHNSRPLVRVGGHEFVMVWVEPLADPRAAANGMPQDLRIAAQRIELREPGPIAVGDKIVVVDELGKDAEVEVSLAQEPAAAVRLTLALMGSARASLSASELVFEPGASLSQSVTITGADDGAYQGDGTLALHLGPAESEDPAFAGQRPSVVRVRVEEPTCELELFAPWNVVRGSDARINWTRRGVCGRRVALTLERDGQLVATLAEETENDGRFDWRFDLSRGQYQLVVRALDGYPVRATRSVNVLRPET